MESVDEEACEALARFRKLWDRKAASHYNGE